MGVEVRRVPFDFDWPLNKRWEGFVNPHYRQCDACDGTGATTASHRLDALAHLLLISGSDAYSGKCHPWLSSGAIYKSGGTPSPDMVTLTNALSERTPDFMGYDAIARWNVVKKIVAAAGLPEDWGTCTTCGGEGIHPEAKAAYDAWTQTPVPEGEGWQMWETASEGSPISPVFQAPDDLARYMSANPWGIQHGTYEQWQATIRQGSTMSFVLANGQFMSGVEAAASPVSRTPPS